MIPTPAKRRHLENHHEVKEEASSPPDTLTTELEASGLSLGEQRNLLLRQRQVSAAVDEEGEERGQLSQFSGGVRFMAHQWPPPSTSSNCLDDVGVNCHHHHQYQLASHIVDSLEQEEDLDQRQEEEEEEEEDYLVLDTIPEEEEEEDGDGDNGENEVNVCQSATTKLQPQLRESGSRQDCDNNGREVDRVSRLTTATSDGTPPTSPLRPPGELANGDHVAVAAAAAAATSGATSSESKITMTSKVTTTPTTAAPPMGQQQQQEDQVAKQPQRRSANNSGNKMHNHHQQLLLPSTNRLISEHQARQQQALFRALAERQKLLDELTPSERQQIDLMCTSSSTATLRTRSLTRQSALSSAEGGGRRNRHQPLAGTGGQQRRRRSRSNEKQRRPAAAGSTSAGGGGGGASNGGGGVPLSSVDLSSMSDGMLDELLGHIASASSSSLSSNGESLDSSDLDTSLAGADSSTTSSCSESASDVEGDACGLLEARLQRRHHQQAQDTQATATVYATAPSQQGSAHSRRRQAAPSVIGVHEDENVNVNQRDNFTHTNQQQHLLRRNQQAAGPRACREAHRKSRRRGSDDDDENNDDDDHDQRKPSELSIGGAGPESSINSITTCGDHLTSVSPTGHQLRCSPPPSLPSHQQQQASPTSTTTTATTGGAASQGSGSVEAVLGRMLEALGEVSASEEQDQLNDLLERGFIHLEQLLNCSLAPTTLQHQHQQHSARSQNMAQKLISSTSGGTSQTAGACNSLLSSQTTISKDSDYGSDTQSADCFVSHCASELLAGPPTPSDHHLNHNHRHHHQQQSQINGLASATSPSAASSSGGESEQSRVSNQQQQSSSLQRRSSGGGGMLSPLAIELSFKLAESLRRLAHQQQVARHHQMPSAATSSFVQPETHSPQPQTAVDQQQQQQQQQQQPITKTATAAAKTRAPMKSVVMLNCQSPGGASACSQQQVLTRPHSAASSGVSPVPAALSAFAVGHGESPLRNLTPNGEERQVAAHNTNGSFSSASSSSTATGGRQYKTRVNINSPQHQSVVVAGAPIEEAPATRATNGTAPPPATSAAAASGKNCIKSEEAEATQVVKVNCEQVIATTSGQQQQQQQHRHRSSLRRRPSFSGSLKSARGEPRPGSPLPLAAIELAQQAAAVSAGGAGQPRQQQDVRSGTLEGKAIEGNAMERQQQVLATGKRERQLQRALVLAQKYNYSPAKLAASKLGSKLQLTSEVALSSRKSPSLLLATTCNGEELETTAASAAVEERPLGANSKVGIAANGLPKNGQSTKGQNGFHYHDHHHHQTSGQVELDISYFARSGSLTVHLLRCVQLAPVSKRRTTSNPYVKLYLLPDRSKSGKRKSSLKRQELNPKFDESFTFGPVQLAHFERRHLWLSVWHKDRLGRNESLGELLLPLKEVRTQLLQSDLCQSTGAKWYRLEARPTGASSGGGGGGNSNSLDSNKSTSRSQGATNNQRQQPIRREMAPPAALEEGSVSYTLKQRQAEQVARKLNEFERKAAQLAQTLAPPSGSGANNWRSNLELQQQVAASVRETSGANGGGNHSVIGGASASGSGVPDSMQVCLGPAQQLSASHSTGGCGGGGSASNTLNNIGLLGGRQAPPVTGQLFVALKFVPDSGDLRRSVQMEGQLRVLIKEARQIAGFLDSKQQPLSDTTTSSNKQQPLPNPQCKCYLLDSNGTRLARHKTSALKRTANPHWDFECAFPNLKLAHLNAQAIEIHLLTRAGGDSLASSLVSGSTTDSLGAIRLCKAQAAIIATHNRTPPLPSSSNHLRETKEQIQADETPTRDQPIQQNSNSNSNSNSEHKCAEAEEALCSERESRLWMQMMARPNIWVYGELPLRHLRPLVAVAPSQSAAPHV